MRSNIPAGRNDPIKWPLVLNLESSSPAPDDRATDIAAGRPVLYNQRFAYLGFRDQPAMFDDLQKRLGSAFGRFRARGLLTEANIKDGLREVRTALLEADVNYNVVQEFMQRVSEQAVGIELIKSVRP